jgi:PAS domain S-box-containing protein
MDGILLADVRTRRLHMPNPRICEMLGYRPDELVRLHVRDLHTPKDLPGVLRSFRQLAAGQIALAPEVPMRRKDGTVFHADISGRRIEVYGRPFLLGVFHDVTKRRRAEELRRQSEETFNKAFHGVPNLMAISTIAEGRILAANDAVLKTMGYARGEFIGRTARELGFYEDYEQRKGIGRLLRTEGRVRNLDVVLRNRWGEQIHGVYHVDIIELGGQKVLLSVLMDVTERRRNEEALRAAEERYRQLAEERLERLVAERTAESHESQARLQRVLDGSNDGYWEWDVAADRVELSARFRQIVGLPANGPPLTRAQVRARVHPDDLPLVTDTTRRAFSPAARSNFYEMEHRHVRPDGGVVWVHTRGTVNARDRRAPPALARGRRHERLNPGHETLEFLHHLDVNPRPVQVVPGPVRLEVDVAGQVVGQEPYPDRVRHQRTRQGQMLQLHSRQDVPDALQIAPNQRLDHVQADGDTVEVALVLSRRTRARPDHVPEVVEHRPAHHGVQVNDADRPTCHIVKHDVVELGVVVGDPHGQPAGLQQVGDPPRQPPALQAELDFPLHAGTASGGVSTGSGLQGRQAAGRVVEERNHLVQSRRGQVGQQALELAERPGRLQGLGWGIADIVGRGPFDEHVGPPERPLVILQPAPPLAGRDQGEAPPFEVAPRGDPELRLKVAGDPVNVLHDRLPIRKDPAVEPLQDIPYRPATLSPRAGVGIVDVPGSIRSPSLVSSRDGKP